MSIERQIVKRNEKVCQVKPKKRKTENKEDWVNTVDWFKVSLDKIQFNFNLFLKCG